MFQDNLSFLKHQLEFATLCFVKSQKSTDVIYTAAEG